MPTLRRAAGAALSSILVSIALSACGDDDSGGEPDAGPAAPVFTVGALLPESGGLAFLNPPTRAGFDVAIAEINGAGGVLGSPVQALVEDSGEDQATATAGATDLLEGGA